MAIQTMDRDAAKKIRVALDEALAKVATGLGLVAESGRATYDPASGKVNFTVSFKTGDSDRKAWDSYCGLYGFKPEHFGLTFKTKKGDVTICGLETARSRFPIKARTAEGKVLLFPADQTLRVLAAQKKIQPTAAWSGHAGTTAVSGEASPAVRS